MTRNVNQSCYWLSACSLSKHSSPNHELRLGLVSETRRPEVEPIEDEAREALVRGLAALAVPELSTIHMMAQREADNVRLRREWGRKLRAIAGNLG